MVDVSNWVAIACAWLAAWWVEQPAPLVRSDCFCNCSCEALLQGPVCPEFSWTWELAKIFSFLILGLILGSLHLGLVIFTAVGNVIGLGISWIRALAIQLGHLLRHPSLPLRGVRIKNELDGNLRQRDSGEL